MTEDRCKQTSPRLQIYKEFWRRPKKWGVFLIKSKINAHPAQKLVDKYGLSSPLIVSYTKSPRHQKVTGALGRGDAALSSVD